MRSNYTFKNIETSIELVLPDERVELLTKYLTPDTRNKNNFRSKKKKEKWKFFILFDGMEIRNQLKFGGYGELKGHFLEVKLPFVPTFSL